MRARGKGRAEPATSAAIHERDAMASVLGTEDLICARPMRSAEVIQSAPATVFAEAAARVQPPTLMSFVMDRIRLLDNSESRIMPSMLLYSSSST